MLIALARLLHAATTSSDGPEWATQPPAPAAAGERPVHAAPEPRPTAPPVIDWDAVAASVRIEITNDGSVLVHGIPNSIPTRARGTDRSDRDGGGVEALAAHPHLTAVPQP